jgi:vitamin B12 transporter
MFGAYISQTGPFGMARMSSSGSKSRDVLVLIDGVRVNDPSSVNNMFDFAHLSADNVERVEVIRGSQSVMHGASATGGVINIITRRGSGSPRIAARAEAGSFRTFRESMSASGGTEESHYSVSLERTDMRGFSSAAKAQGATAAPERDGYENTTVSSRMGMKVLGDSRLNCSIRYY